MYIGTDFALQKFNLISVELQGSIYQFQMVKQYDNTTHLTKCQHEPGTYQKALLSENKRRVQQCLLNGPNITGNARHKILSIYKTVCWKFKIAEVFSLQYF